MSCDNSSDSLGSENDQEAKSNKSNKSNKSKRYNEYMKNYMREYRKKQKLQQEERSHCCKIRNQLVNETDVEDLLTKAIKTLINIINKNSDSISIERIDRINDNKYDFFKYSDLIIKTVEELINNNEN